MQERLTHSTQNITSKYVRADTIKYQTAHFSKAFTCKYSRWCERYLIVAYRATPLPGRFSIKARTSCRCRLRQAPHLLNLRSGQMIQLLIYLVLQSGISNVTQYENDKRTLGIWQCTSGHDYTQEWPTVFRVTFQILHCWSIKYKKISWKTTDEACVICSLVSHSWVILTASCLTYSIQYSAKKGTCSNECAPWLLNSIGHIKFNVLRNFHRP